MTRDDLRGIIEGITDEQLKKVLDINSSDIGKAKGEVEDLKLQLSETCAKLEEHEKLVKSLEESQCEAENLKVKIDELQTGIDQSKQADAEKKSREALKSRFDSAAGDVRFLNSFTRDGLFDEFLTALEDEKNAAMSDEEIFGGLVENRENIFVPDGGIPSVIASTIGFGGRISDGDIREIMGLPPQD